MSAHPLVTVITVCLNAERTIAPTIESVLEQTYEHVEYLVIDGGSTDGTLRIAEEAVPRFGGRMRCVSGPDRGLYDAMNTGVGLAAGEYVAFLNADDHYYPEAIALLVGAIEHEGGDIAYGGMTRCVSFGGERRYVPPKEATLRPLMRAMPACHEAMLYRRDLHDRVGGYSLEYGVAADYEFLLRCLAGGATAVPVDAPVVHFEAGGASDRDPAAVEREYRAVRVKYGASPLAEWLRSERSIFNGRAYGALTALPVIGRSVKAAYERRERAAS